MMRRGLRFLACLAALLSATGGVAAADGLAAARQRGELVVGVPYLAPAPVAGAKIRTPEGLDIAMAEKLAQDLGLPFSLRQVAAADAARLLAAGEVDIVLADRAQPAQALPGDLAAVATGYAARPKAVIRSDTRMRQGSDARGRSVCMAEAAVGAQALARGWGAVVRTYRVPSDALVAVREGSCDVGLIDDAVWEPLMRFPEWKKFSATLRPDGARSERVWLLPAADTATQSWLDARMREWARADAWKALTAKWARDVAFDVYLDQEVADCHG
ncbi:transporter substrate-binding domain-containing protein [Achromobacter xylosoxidans]|uniref:transporter substrate-binding domain-containing protein n=1 Tax=Alcaligenes xylosoxydans xylosoxydans TaxID=85698 RepID=UPI00128DE824|nr:transporter substrate-binding domain-containing protein [Achromobacter xylosoxidans]MCH1995613.1 transporter substrate-binding domain-containing protein [Achromobacter xylosoxidans]WPQ35786.1 transporter substrate-binding domain-containing protein [Achromobacter xylosoxidans]